MTYYDPAPAARKPSRSLSFNDPELSAEDRFFLWQYGGRPAPEVLPLFYGTSRARLKVITDRNRVLGPHNRLCLDMHFKSAETVAFRSVARDIYHGNLLRAAGFKPADGDYEAAAADYALDNRDGLFRTLEQVYLTKKQLGRVAEESFIAVSCLCSRGRLPADENGPVIAVLDGPRMDQLGCSFGPHRVFDEGRDEADDEAKDVLVFSSVYPLDEVLLGTVDVRLPDPTWISDILLSDSKFWVPRLPESFFEG